MSQKNSSVQKAAADLGMATFVLSSVATMSATVFSNPMEVVKTRMQLQGEATYTTPSSASAASSLSKPSASAVGVVRATTAGHAAAACKNPAQVFVTILREEGIRGVQSGLGSGMAYQSVMNGIRLGMFEKACAKYAALLAPYAEPIGKDNMRFLATLLAATTSSGLGAMAGAPLYVAKTRMQAYSTGSVKVGTQHRYAGIADFISKTVKTEGITGLYRGASASVARVCVGGTTQLVTYDRVKHHLVTRFPNFANPDMFRTHFAASLATSLVVVAAMNPIDVITTRIVNQPAASTSSSSSTSSGAMRYSGIVDCAAKIARYEGLKGFYGGSVAHFARQGPHTILTFVFWEQLKMAYTRYAN